MQNFCNGWNSEDFSYINLSPDESVGEAHRAWQGCPTMAITRGGGFLQGGLRAVSLNPASIITMCLL